MYKNSYRRVDSDGVMVEQGEYTGRGWKREETKPVHFGTMTRSTYLYKSEESLERAASQGKLKWGPWV